MMRRSIAIVVALCLSVGAVFASGDKDFKAFVHTLNLQVAKAYESKDSKFFDSLYSPDFQARDEHGVLQRRKEALFVVRFQLNVLKILDYKTIAQTVKGDKTHGTVVSTTKMIGMTQSRRGEPPQKVEIVRHVSEDYEKRGNTWVLVSRKELAAPITKMIASTPLAPAKKKPGKGG